MPLPPNEVSSSVLVASYSQASCQNGKLPVGGGKSPMGIEVEKGLLTLISSDCAGVQVSFHYLRVIKTFLIIAHFLNCLL